MIRASIEEDDNGDERSTPTDQGLNLSFQARQPAARLGAAWNLPPAAPFPGMEARTHGRQRGGLQLHRVECQHEA